jgi:signal transduction histidine kinase
MTKNDRFDSQLELSEIFTENDLARIKQALSLAFSCTIEIVGLGTNAKPGWRRVEILWELETIAYLESAQATTVQLKGGADIFLLLLKEAVRYRMASKLHTETIIADFEVLQEKHAELQESEARYKELSKKLEEKVAAQVKEIKDAELKIFLSEKLASVGQLAAGVAHEFNTPLAYIQNNLAVARDYLRDLESFFATVLHSEDIEALRDSWKKVDIDYIREDFPVLLGSCLDGVARLSSIVSDLKIFSNNNQLQLKLDNINARLITVLNMLKPQINEGIEIVQDFADLPEILCYPAHLGQAFYNIILNGVQAIEGEGRVVIRTFEKDGCINVYIADTGAGIQENDIPRIFDPFFTTKEVGKGTGLGLSVVHDVIKTHQGRIEIQSKPGKGSTFTLILPVETIPAQERGK